MEDFLIFILHCVSFIGAAITTLFINQYSTLIAVAFCALYLVTVNSVAKELNQ